MIHFVGAGCGAPDLITVRGMHLLEKADVIIYAGSLVNPELLNYAKADCQVYNSAVMTLEEVLAVMVEAEQEGKDVVRLHTGEPSIYGAVQEQMQELDAKKIAYDSTEERITPVMLQTIREQQIRTGVSDEAILGMRAIKAKKVSEMTITEYKAVMKKFEKTPDRKDVTPRE